jgi:signal transduction histidine kinase
MVAIYSAARHTPGNRGVWYCVAAIVAITPTGLLHEEIPGPSQFLWLGLICGAPAVAGRTLLNRSRIQDELRARTRELERESELRAGRAVEDERVRIAGELQAVVANGVSAMVVQAEAIPRVIAAGETKRAADSLALIEETGRDALVEMRRLLGVLRRDENAAALAPQPSLSQAGRLAQHAQTLGLAVAIEHEGERVELPFGLDLAAYRVLEETLDFAAQEGASKATIVISYGDDELRLEVRDDRSLVQPEDVLRRRDRNERLALYGGRVRSEPLDDGPGQRLLARLPMEGAVA